MAARIMKLFPSGRMKEHNPQGVIVEANARRFAEELPTVIFFYATDREI
jgi:hypothetical protein